MADPDPLELADPADRAIVERALPLSMTGPARLLALVDAVRHIVARGVAGELAECGVWRGGSVLAMALTLIDSGDTARELWLYDTFEGMTRPTQADVSVIDAPALATWEEAQRAGHVPWPELFAAVEISEESVREAVLASGYPADHVCLVRGPVEETIPEHTPESLALLRLDTDWYESTRHELEHLWPRLSSGGVLIVDDYGHWQGARQAVDEYFAAHPPAPLLHRVDYTARIAVKA